MAQVMFNDRFLVAAKCKDGEIQVDHFDAGCPGLSIRVALTGRKTWSFTYTSPRDQRRAKLKIGTYPATTLLEARTRTEEMRGHVEKGTDPRDLQTTERAKTVRELCDERLAMEVDGIKNGKGEWVKKPLRTAADIRRRYNKYIIPLVGDIAVPDFKIDPHYNKCIDPLVKRGKLRQAGVIHTDLMTLMEFAKRRGVIEFSRIEAAVSPDPKNVRKRYLTLPEIVTVWHELPKAIVRSKADQFIVKLLLATSKRVSEVSEAKRTEINWATMIWTIPAERVKNGDKFGPDYVPISPFAARLLRQAMMLSNSEYIFPNKEADGGTPNEVVASAVRRSIDAGDFTVPKWTPHDLRRTVGTQMLNKANGLGITKSVKYLVLNHRSGDEEGHEVSDQVYDQNTYFDEKREALDKWGAFLAKLVGEEIEEREAA